MPVLINDVKVLTHPSSVGVVFLKVEDRCVTGASILLITDERHGPIVGQMDAVTVVGSCLKVHRSNARSDIEVGSES